jgi:RNA polymerase sigma-32 factor
MSDDGKENLPILASTGEIQKSRDLLGFYLREVRRYPLLSSEEEREFAVRYQETGDQEAAERLVTANLRLVIKIAFQYHRQWSNVLDLIQEGNLGLVEALKRYDPFREVRFSSYAQYWVRAMILRFLLDNFRLVTLGRSRAGRKLFFQLNKERERLIAQGVDPTPKLLGDRLGVSETEVHAVDQHLRAPALSFDMPMGDGPDGRTLSEIVPEVGAKSPEEAAARSELGARVDAKLKEFEQTFRDERERLIWERRLRSNDRASLSELGNELGVSKERVRQLEARMKNRLKGFLEQEFGDEIGFEFDIPEDNVR